MVVPTGEGTRAVQCSPNGYSCTHKSSRDSFTRPDPDRNPYQNGEGKKSQRIVLPRHYLAALKERPCPHAQQQERYAHFQQLRAIPAERVFECIFRYPEDDSWRNDQSPNDITEPPGNPNLPIPLPVRIAS